MPARTDLEIKLSDGLTISYAEYGDPQGRPVIHLHGLPSSRFEVNIPGLIAIAERMGVRVILPDRPGIGHSGFRPYTIATYPDLLAAFADALEIERFAVTGWSSGGKFALACAWKMPQRCSSVTSIAGSAPFDLPGVWGSLSSQDRLLYTLADKAPWLFRMLLAKIAADARKNPESVLSLFNVSAVDKAAMSDPDVRRLLGEMVNGSFQHGTRGAARDWLVEARPWGFPCQEIAMPVNIWHGEEDILVPIEHARVLGKVIPHARLKLVPNEGHTMFVTRFEELLATAAC